MYPKSHGGQAGSPTNIQLKRNSQLPELGNKSGLARNLHDPSDLSQRSQAKRESFKKKMSAGRSLEMQAKSRGPSRAEVDDDWGDDASQNSNSFITAVPKKKTTPIPQLKEVNRHGAGKEKVLSGRNKKAPNVFVSS